MKKLLKFSVVAAVMLVMIFAMSTSIFSAYAYVLDGEGVCDVELGVGETASISFIPATSGYYIIESDRGDTGIDPVCWVYLDGEQLTDGDDGFETNVLKYYTISKQALRTSLRYVIIG